MSRKSRLRAVAALFVVIACILAVPAKAQGTIFTMDSISIPVKILNAAMDWFRGLGSVPRERPVGAHHKPAVTGKLGAGQSSDGHSAAAAKLPLY
jgi:hypothetical protein